jgi:hypothetical protein
MAWTYGVIIDGDDNKIQYVTGENSVEAFNKVLQIAKDVNDTVFTYRLEDAYEALVDHNGNTQVLFGGW